MNISRIKGEAERESESISISRGLRGTHNI